MKSHKLSKSILISAIGLMVASSYAAIPGKFYLGVFGGVASPNKFDINQYGTAFYTEALGGPLAVNAFGRASTGTSGLIGGQVGFQGMMIPLHPAFGVLPAIELEGYYITKKSFTASDVNNNTTRLPEHDFIVTFPTKTSVFLTNVVFNVDSCYLGNFHPYLGLGFGGAIASISGADATQISPPEVGINHFNSQPSDTAATFAGQTKVGLSYNFCNNFSTFIEYRWLYLSSTSYAFGSTVYAGHPATSNWQVKMDPRSYNIGTIGIRYSF